VIWTDCDREGEAIGFDVIEVCKTVRNRIDVYRAHFSTLTREDLERAAMNLGRPNKYLADAVNVRQEIDLRIGASFTRFQTLTLQKIVHGDKKGSVISYGPCQFPTLGFIVERHKQIVEFREEPFWKIELKYSTEKEEAKFVWARGHLFDKQSVQALYERVEDAKLAKVTNV
jgi:DNA topoisomerase-3